MPPVHILPADSVVAETDDPLSAGLAGQLVSQWTRTWKESADPDKDAKLDRIEHVTGPSAGRQGG
jgi:hypothetical protein